MKRYLPPLETNEYDVKRAKVWRNGLIIVGMLTVIGSIIVTLIVQVGQTARVPIQGEAKLHCKITTWKELPNNLSLNTNEGHLRMLPDYVECDAGASGSVPGGQLISAIVAQAMNRAWDQ